MLYQFLLNTVMWLGLLRYMKENLPTLHLGTTRHEQNEGGHGYLLGEI
jgi:hypothetical protein